MPTSLIVSPHSAFCHHPGRRIYAAAGYAGLRRSEAYQEASAFELDAADAYHAFFDGRQATAPCLPFTHLAHRTGRPPLHTRTTHSAYPRTAQDAPA